MEMIGTDMTKKHYSTVLYNIYIQGLIEALSFHFFQVIPEKQGFHIIYEPHRLHLFLKLCLESLRVIIIQVHMHNSCQSW